MLRSQRSRDFELATTSERLQVGGVRVKLSTRHLEPWTIPTHVCRSLQILQIFRGTARKILNSMLSITDLEYPVKKEQVIIPIRRYFWVRNFVIQKREAEHSFPRNALSLYRALEHLLMRTYAADKLLKKKSARTSWGNCPEVVIRIVSCFRRLWGELVFHPSPQTPAQPETTFLSHRFICVVSDQ